MRPTDTKYISCRDNNTGRVYKKNRRGTATKASIRSSIVTMPSGFRVGYAPNRPGALVEVKEVRDEETKEPIVYEYQGNPYTALEIDYFLGKIIEKINC